MCLGLLLAVTRARILWREPADFPKDNRSTGTFPGRGIHACVCMYTCLCACPQRYKDRVETWIYIMSSNLKKGSQRSCQYRIPCRMEGTRTAQRIQRIKEAEFPRSLLEQNCIKSIFYRLFGLRQKLFSCSSGFLLSQLWKKCMQVFFELGNNFLSYLSPLNPGICPPTLIHQFRPGTLAPTPFCNHRKQQNFPKLYHL